MSIFAPINDTHLSRPDFLLPGPLGAARDIHIALEETMTMTTYRIRLSHFVLASHLLLATPQPLTDPVRWYISTIPGLDDTLHDAMWTIHDLVTQTSTPAQARDFVLDIGTACRMMVEELEREHETYLANMTILYQELNAKLEADVARTGSWYESALRLPEGSEVEINGLIELVGDLPLAPWHRRYLKDIREYWRVWGRCAEEKKFEVLWTYVAGRNCLLE